MLEKVRICLLICVSSIETDETGDLSIKILEIGFIKLMF